MSRASDPARGAALTALQAVRGGGYANLALAQVLRDTGLTGTDAAFVTELVAGTSRHQGTLDRIIEAAGGRALRTLQPGVVDVLRLGAEQILKLRVPPHAAVATSVTLAEERIGRRVTGVVNAILRRVAARDWVEWLDHLAAGLGPSAALALRTAHPEWIVAELARLLPEDELPAALAANNRAPSPTLVVRPGLMTRDELLASGGAPTPYSPWGVVRTGDPGPVVADGRAGVQDEGSQLVAGVLADVPAPVGHWLDMCAGPGGKAALLTGLARARGETLLAAELQPHRARLVAQALQGYGVPRVVVADGRTPAWGARFTRIMLDAPCTGLGALRRRPEARWRKTPADLAALTTLQTDLLRAAVASLTPGGVVAYVTCSPVVAETADVVAAVTATADAEILEAPALLPDVPRAAATTDARFIQLWPHRHGTDAMFCALLRRR